MHNVQKTFKIYKAGLNSAVFDKHIEQFKNGGIWRLFQGGRRKTKNIHINIPVNLYKYFNTIRNHLLIKERKSCCTRTYQLIKIMKQKGISCDIPS